MKISELAGENWPGKFTYPFKSAGACGSGEFAPPSITEQQAWNNAIDACDLTVELDVEAITSILREYEEVRFEQRNLGMRPSSIDDIAQSIAQSAKQFIKIVKE